VQPKLSEALLARKVEETQKLRNILIAINRFSSLEQQYTRVRMRPLRRVSIQPPKLMERVRSQKSRPVCCCSSLVGTVSHDAALAVTKLWTLWYVDCLEFSIVVGRCLGLGVKTFMRPIAHLVLQNFKLFQVKSNMQSRGPLPHRWIFLVRQ
jgi:hypothetical protein